jgi:alpha-galactosidase
MREKIVLIGAGSAMFTRGLVADLIRQGWICDLALVDTDPDALAVAEGLVRKMARARRARFRLSAALDRREALRNATVVITTIGVGGRRAWEQDVAIPRRYGIFQPVGDSVMPGGSSRALRMIPAMVAIAEDVLDLAPGALFFNYANPMGVLCRAVRKATGADMVGLCHGVFHTGGQVARALGIPRGRLAYTAVGMNHLTWFTEVRADGGDAMPRLRALAERRCAGLSAARDLGLRFAEGGAAGRGRAVFPDPFTAQMLLRFGAFPCPGDRHITEFFPSLFARQGAYFGRTLGVEAYPFEATIANGDAIFEEMREHALSRRPLPDDYFGAGAGEHEQAMEILDCIRSGTPRIYSANLPNRGQVSNLPEEAILECPAVTGSEGLRPVVLPPLDPALVGTLAARFQWVEVLVEAALRGSRERFVQALLLDGAVRSVPEAESLANDLIAAHIRHLPQFRDDARPPRGGRMRVDEKR